MQLAGSHCGIYFRMSLSEYHTHIDAVMSAQAWKFEAGFFDIVYRVDGKTTVSCCDESVSAIVFLHSGQFCQFSQRLTP